MKKLFFLAMFVSLVSSLGFYTYNSVEQVNVDDVHLYASTSSDEIEETIGVYSGIYKDYSCIFQLTSIQNNTRLAYVEHYDSGYSFHTWQIGSYHFIRVNGVEYFEYDNASNL